MKSVNNIYRNICVCVSTEYCDIEGTFPVGKPPVPSEGTAGGIIISLREFNNENVGKTGTIREIEKKSSTYKYINSLFSMLLCLMSALAQYTCYLFIKQKSITVHFNDGSTFII